MSTRLTLPLRTLAFLGFLSGGCHLVVPFDLTSKEGDASTVSDDGAAPAQDAATVGSDAAAPLDADVAEPDAGPEVLDSDEDGLPDSADPCPDEENRLVGDDFDGWVRFEDYGYWEISEAEAYGSSVDYWAFAVAPDCAEQECIRSYILDVTASYDPDGPRPTSLGLEGPIQSSTGAYDYCLWYEGGLEIGQFLGSKGTAFAEHWSDLPTQRLRLVVSPEGQWCAKHLPDAPIASIVEPAFTEDGPVGVIVFEGEGTFTDLRLYEIPVGCTPLQVRPEAPR